MGFILIRTFALLPCTGYNNDSGLNLYSVSRTLKLDIPKCQCSFTLFTAVCIVGGVTSCSLSQVLLNI